MNRTPPALVALLLAYMAAPVVAQNVFREAFEGPAPTWGVVSSDLAYRIASHERVRGQAHAGQGCEQLQLFGNNGSFVYLGHWIRPARIISELRPTVWLKADRPGLQMFVRAVLPRTLDPRTGKPITTLIPGDRYPQSGLWQQLCVQQIAEQLTSKVRVLRAEFGPDVDPREAYIDQVILNIYGGPGLTTVSIDQLEVGGVIGPRDASGLQLAVAYEPEPLGAAPRVPAATPSTATSSTPAPSAHPQLQGALLVVDGQPMLPRIIQHRGEPLAELEQLGFNVVLLSEQASEPLLREAARLGLWLIAPPPAAPELQQTGITTAYDPVLAWSLGSNLSGHDLERVRALAREVRQADPRVGRPLIADCASDLRSFSRIADVLVIGGSPLGTSLELSDYTRWLAERPQFARPGTPIWNRIQTDYDALLHAQWQTLALSPVRGAACGPEQIRMLTYASLAAGARGLVFDSHRALTETDAAAQQRRLTLELINLELRLIGPWATTGSTRTSAHSSDPAVTGAALQTERSRLVLPLAAAPHDQYVPLRSPVESVAFVVPGAPESSNVYELTPAGLPPLRHQRVTGGIRITQERSDACSMMVLTGDPRIISSLSHKIADVGRRAAELQRELAAHQLSQVEWVHRRLSQGGEVAKQCDQWLAEARAHGAQANVLWAASDYRGAYREARRALGALGRVERARWSEAVETWPSVMTSPFAVSFDTLPQHAEFAGRLAQSRLQPSRLPSGDLENLDEMLRAGWKHVEHQVDGVHSQVELSLLEPQSGRSSLRLKSWPSDEDQPPALIETAPVWVTSAPVMLEAGQLVRIAGWVRVPKPITGSTDGLLVVDSLGGAALAARFSETMSWQEFIFYRVAPESGPLTVTFALTGFGEAWIDNLRVEPVAQPPQPPVAQAALR